MDPMNHDDQCQRLSALMDGELDASEADRACSAWQAASDPRGAWHAYHVIGDVLRSEELGCAADDEAFLRRLRGELAKEPLIVAPVALTGGGAVDAAPAVAAVAVGGGRARRSRWVAPMGMAAGVAAVAVTAFVLQKPLTGPAPAGEGLARADAPSVMASGLIPPAPPANVAVAVSVAPAVELERTEPAQVAQAERVVPEVATPAEEPTVLRSPLIDRYLSAHKSVAGATALGPSANFIRSATYEAPAR